MKSCFSFKYIFSLLFCLTVLNISIGKAQQATADSVVTVDSVESAVATPIEDEEIESTSTKRKSSSFNNKDVYPELIDQRSLNNDSIKKLFSDDDFWYANAHPKKEQRPAQNNDEEHRSFWDGIANFFGSEAVRVIAWILVALVFIAIIVSFVMSDGGLFKGSAKKIKTEEKEDEIPDNIFEIDFAKEIQKAIGEDNLALGVRLLFLQSLKTMSEKGIIEYSIDKTNFDYLFSLNGTKYFNDFSKLVRNYEYVWYGKFPISKERFLAVERNFNDYKNLIN